MSGVFAAIGRFFSDLLKTITDALAWIAALVTQVFVDLWEFCTDVPVWIFDALLEIAGGAVEALDLSGLTQYAAAWGGLPAEMLNVLGLIGLGEALGIIAAAALIRLGMQVIPFVRLGS
jgi:hypothetical protein